MWIRPILPNFNLLSTLPSHTLRRLRVRLDNERTVRDVLSSLAMSWGAGRLLGLVELILDLGDSGVGAARDNFNRPYVFPNLRRAVNLETLEFHGSGTQDHRLRRVLLGAGRAPRLRRLHVGFAFAYETGQFCEVARRVALFPRLEVLELPHAHHLPPDVGRWLTSQALLTCVDVAVVGVAERAPQGLSSITIETVGRMVVDLAVHVLRTSPSCALRLKVDPRWTYGRIWRLPRGGADSIHAALRNGPRDATFAMVGMCRWELASLEGAVLEADRRGAVSVVVEEDRLSDGLEPLHEFLRRMSRVRCPLTSIDIHVMWIGANDWRTQLILQLHRILDALWWQMDDFPIVRMVLHHDCPFYRPSWIAFTQQSESLREYGQHLKFEFCSHAATT
jgi:hypothetical protein